MSHKPSVSHDLLFNMADQACVRAWEDEGWGPYHKRLLTMCIKIDNTCFKKVENSMIRQVWKHIRKTGSISIREAMDDYSLSGGHLTKIISVLRREGHTIKTDMKKHPITGRKYARYSLTLAA